MTCIAAWIEDGVITMGGDSAGIAGLSSSARADEKVFTNGPYLMGFTTSFRMGDILRYTFSPPEYARGDVRKFMVASFVPELKQALRAGGWEKKENERTEGGTFLVGCYGRLFCIQSDYQVSESRDCFDARGCGADVALGVLYALSDFEMSARERITLALKSAEHVSTSIRAPFVIKSKSTP